MKKLWEQIKDKAIMGLIMSMLGIGGTFLYNTGIDLWNLPATVKHLKSIHTQDSLKAVEFIQRIMILEVKVEVHDDQILNNQKNKSKTKYNENNLKSNSFLQRKENNNR